MEELLLAWFAEHGRELPWRGTRDPYAILVSEVMLQQTQVSRVVPRYLEWLDRWPTVESLATASPADAIRAWQGLGYNRRGLALHRAAGMIVERGWPDDLTELPGVGPYTAAAIGNFAFGRPVLPVDVNVGRVLSRSGARVRPRGGPGTVRPRRNDLSRPRAALRRLPAVRRLSLGRSPLRARTEAEPVRRVVPPATRAAPPPRRCRAAAARAGSGGARVPRRRWSGRRGRAAG